MSSQNSSPVVAILYAFLCNLGIALAKTWATIVTGSSSMLAEALHSYADTGNQVLLFIGLRRSSKAPDTEHPLGYGKASYFWSFIVATLLFSVGGVFSIYHGYHKLLHPEPISDVWIAVIVLVVSIGLETTSLYGCLREIKHARGDRQFMEWLKNTRSAEFVVVLGEDTAALLGLCLALMFVLLAYVTGNPIYDAIGSISIGTVLIVVAVSVAIRVRTLLVGRSADPEVRDAIDQTIAEHAGVDRLLNTITLQLGPDTMLSAQIKLTPGTDMETGVATINELERTLKEKIPDLRWTFIEPDFADDDQAAGP